MEVRLGLTSRSKSTLGLGSVFTLVVKPKCIIETQTKFSSEIMVDLVFKFPLVLTPKVAGEV